MQAPAAVRLAILVALGLAGPAFASEPGKPGAAAGGVVTRPASAASSMTMADPVGSFAPMLARVIPSVVTIRVVSETPEPYEIRPGDTGPAPAPRKIASRSGGSGVIVDPANGHILTNNHVIDGAVRIEVVLSDGRWMLGRLVGRDIGTDVAVVEVAARDLPGVAIGDSDRVRVGDVVAAIGNPFGLEGTATLGIVSATMRSEVGHEAFEDFLQIDAVINPGNSGGALVNVRGELIGINTATAGRNGNVGIGFAIPINMARSIKQELIAHGRMRRGSPGLLVEDLSYERAASLMSGTNRGAVVTRVAPGSPAARAGILPGSIVTEAAGKPVRGAAEFNARVAALPEGARLPLIVRADGADRSHMLETAAVSFMADEHAVPAELGDLAGLVVADITLGNPLYGDLRGAQVVRVSEGQPAARLGLRAGDVIVGLDDGNVRSSEHLFRHAARAAGSAYRVRLVRDGRPAWVRVAR